MYVPINCEMNNRVHTTSIGLHFLEMKMLLLSVTLIKTLTIHDIINAY